MVVPYHNDTAKPSDAAQGSAPHSTTTFLPPYHSTRNKQRTTRMALNGIMWRMYRRRSGSMLLLLLVSMLLALPATTAFVAPSVRRQPLSRLSALPGPPVDVQVLRVLSEQATGKDAVEATVSSMATDAVSTFVTFFFVGFGLSALLVSMAWVFLLKVLSDATYRCMEKLKADFPEDYDFIQDAKDAYVEANFDFEDEDILDWENRDISDWWKSIDTWIFVYKEKPELAEKIMVDVLKEHFFAGDEDTANAVAASMAMVFRVAWDAEMEE